LSFASVANNNITCKIVCFCLWLYYLWLLSSDFITHIHARTINALHLAWLISAINVLFTLIKYFNVILMFSQNTNVSFILYHYIVAFSFMYTIYTVGFCRVGFFSGFFPSGGYVLDFCYYYYRWWMVMLRITPPNKKN